MKKLVFLPFLFALLACKAQQVTPVSQPVSFLKWIKVHDSVRASIYFQNVNDTLATRAYARGFAGGGAAQGYGIKVTGSTIAIDSLNYRKVDSLYPLTDSTFILKINGRSYTFKMRGAVQNWNGRVGAVTPQDNDYAAFYPKLDSTYADPSFISALAWSKIIATPNSLGTYGIIDGVKNGGGAAQWIADIESNRPNNPVNGTFFFGIDDSVTRYWNGSRYIIASGGGSETPDTVYNFSYGLLTSRVGGTVTVKLDTTTLKPVFGGGGSGIFQIFTKWPGLLINGTDTVSIDTSVVTRWSDTLSRLASRSYVTSRGYLTAETDPVAGAKVITLNGTAGRGISIAGTAGQALGTSPVWTFTADTTYLSTLLALKDSSAALRSAIGGGGGISQVYNKYGTIIAGGDSITVDTTIFTRWKDTVSGPIATRTFVTSRGYLTTETDPVALNTNITLNQARGILITGLSSQKLNVPPVWTVAADTTVMATQSYTNRQGFLKTETDPVALAKTVTATQGYGVVITGTAGQALSTNPAWTFTTDSSVIAAKSYVAANFLPKTGTYHLFFRAQGSTPATAGDTTYVSGHDSTITIAGIVDSLGFHHYIQAGRLVMYASAGSGTLTADTASIAQVLTATGDSLKVNTTSVPAYLGTKVFIPGYTPTAAGIMTVQKGKRLDSTVHVKWGIYHHLVRAPWTKDSLEIKGISFQDSTGKLKFTLMGDTTHGLLWNIDASGLAGSGTVDSVSLAYTSNPIFLATLTGNKTVNPVINLSASTACAGCFLQNNTAGIAVPTYALPSLTGPSFANTGTAITLLHGNATGNLSFGAVNFATDVTGTMNAAQMPAITGDVGITVGTLTSAIGAGKVTNAMLAGGIDLTQKVTGILPSNNGGTGVNNGGRLFTMAGNHTLVGAFASTFTFTAATNVTFPTSGTLLTTTGNGSGLSGLPLSLQGTANQVLVNNDVTGPHTGILTLTLPQNIAPANSPIFTNLGLSALTTTGMTKYNSTTGAFSIGISGSDYAPGTAALSTGIIKSTTATGAFTIAAANDFPLLNQNTTGTAGGLLATAVLPTGVTAATQTTGDASTKLATDQFVANAVTAAAAAYYQIVQANGVNVTQRQHLNFGAEFNPVDNSGNTSTDISIAAIPESKVTNLSSDLAAKAALASPAFTGVPTVPTATGGTNTTQAASTAFVTGALGSYALLASPAFTGVPTAPTATNGTNSTQIATTAFMQTALAGFAPLTSPAFLGTPTVPTAAGGTNTTQAASTAFVTTAISNLSGGAQMTGGQQILIGSTTSGTIAGNVNTVVFSDFIPKSTYTLTMPPSPVDGQFIWIFSNPNISIGSTVVTSFTIAPNAGQSIYMRNAPTTLVGGDEFVLRWSAPNAAWLGSKF